MGNVCRKVKLGQLPFGVPEFKVEFEGHPIPHPVTYTRQSRLSVYAEFCGPDNIINGVWNDIETCALVAAGAAALSSLAESPVGALPTFKAAFLACLIAKVGDQAKQISVALSTSQESGDWHKV